MPLNDIIAERHGGATPASDSLPENDGAPDTENDDTRTTFRNLDKMMPPYLHNQTMSNRSMFTMVGTGLSIIFILGKMV